MHEPVRPIRCELDRSRADLAAPLVRSFVHHHCTLVDCDVATVDALEAATAEVLDAVTDRSGIVTGIELVPDMVCVEIRLSIDVAGDAPPTFPQGPVARAAALHAAFGQDGRLRLWHRFREAGQP